MSNPWLFDYKYFVDHWEQWHIENLALFINDEMKSFDNEISRLKSTGKEIADEFWKQRIKLDRAMEALKKIAKQECKPGCICGYDCCCAEEIAQEAIEEIEKI